MMHQRVGAAVAGLGVLAVTIAGCGQATPIPADAQVIQVSATDSQLRLEPASVRAGDVYLVVDESMGGVEFISELPPDFQTGGRDRLPLSDEDIASIRAIGSAEGTAVDAYSIGGHGNVFKVTVFAGMYALTHDRLVAILEVQP